TGVSPQSPVIGDFNLDGKPDLAVANFVDNNVTIMLGNGTGTFSASSTVDAVDGPASVAIGDFNLDGKPDLAVVNSGSGFENVAIRLGDGTGGFPDSDGSLVGAGSLPSSVAIGDFNQDGKPDLAVANFGDINGGSVTVQLNTTVVPCSGI